MKYTIPCPEGFDHDYEHPDYYPLTMSEVIDLLTTARDASANWLSCPTPEARQTFLSIESRLEQAVPGTVCPHEIDGPVHEKHMALNEAYVQWIEDPGTLSFKDVPIAVNDAIVVTLMKLYEV